MKDNQNFLLSRNDVFERYGITKRYLETVDAAGTGPTVTRIGRLVRYRVKDVEAWLDQLAGEGNA